MKWKITVTLLVLGILFSTGVLASTQCPAVVFTGKIHPSDQACLNDLEQQFKTFSNDDSLAKLRFSLLFEHEPANEDLVVEHIYYQYCKFVQQQSEGSEPSIELQRLNKAKAILFARSDNRRIVFRTDNISMQEDLLKRTEYAVFPSPDPTSFLYVAMPSTSQNDEEQTSLTTPSVFDLDLLREPPYVITKRNRHFVMVGSTPNFNDAKRTATRYKREHPQLNFVVYDRYAGNPNYSIMMATWVSYDVAKIAEKYAQDSIRFDSRIWSCRGRDGVTC